MKGRAPNCPATGSQTLVVQNEKPNFCTESHDWRKSSKPIDTTTSAKRHAKAPVAARKPKSRDRIGKDD
jgi:hypothetical protein